jgi:Lon protease-like protein
MEARVHELPLFPLSVVLFPGQSLPLHIFESRYRVMIKKCVDNNEPFGVVLAEGEEPDAPAPVGTSARVTEVKRLPDGRMNIVTLGEDRFRLHDFRESEHGYLIGDVSDFPLAETEPVDAALTAKVRRQLARYLKLLADANGMKFRFDPFPETPNDIALFAAIALRLPLEAKQALLAEEQLAGLLRHETQLLGEELKMLQIVASAIQPPEDNHIFSRN